METRVIRNEAGFRQPVLFTGLRFGDVEGTDIDCCLDFHDKAIIFIEIKYNGSPLTTGQRILLERLCNHLEIPSIAIFAYHTKTIYDDVIVKDCFVQKVYFNKVWWNYNNGMTVYQVIRNYLIKIGIIV